MTFSSSFSSSWPSNMAMKWNLWLTDIMYEVQAVANLKMVPFSKQGWTVKISKTKNMSKTCLTIILDGPLNLKQTEVISGELPLVSVKHSEWRRLTSECGYSPAWENFVNDSMHENLFDVFGIYCAIKTLCLFGVT